MLHEDYHTHTTKGILKIVNFIPSGKASWKGKLFEKLTVARFPHNYMLLYSQVVINGDN
jgi:hypothetical protein